jgi:hypothetical protein
MILLTVLKFPVLSQVLLNQFKCAEVSETWLKPEYATCDWIEDRFCGATAAGT